MFFHFKMTNFSLRTFHDGTSLPMLPVPIGIRPRRDPQNIHTQPQRFMLGMSTCFRAISRQTSNLGRFVKLLGQLFRHHSNPRAPTTVLGRSGQKALLGKPASKFSLVCWLWTISRCEEHNLLSEQNYSWTHIDRRVYAWSEVVVRAILKCELTNDVKRRTYPAIECDIYTKCLRARS